MTKHFQDHPRRTGGPDHKEEGKIEKGEKDQQAAKDLETLEHASYEALEAKLNEAEAKANDNWNQFLRAQADLENLRKRSERDISNAHRYGLEKIVTDLLPVADSLERGLAGTPPTDERLKSMRDGLEMTLTLLLKTLEKFGVKQLNPLGEAFNPEWHQAMATKEDAAVAPHTVLEVLQKGYVLQDRLIRPALVVVSKN